VWLGRRELAEQTRTDKHNREKAWFFTRRALESSPPFGGFLPPPRRAFAVRSEDGVVGALWTLVAIDSVTAELRPLGVFRLASAEGGCECCWKNASAGATDRSEGGEEGTGDDEGAGDKGWDPFKVDAGEGSDRGKCAEGDDETLEPISISEPSLQAAESNDGKKPELKSPCSSEPKKV